MIAIFNLLDTILQLYSYIIIASVVVSWLQHFGVLNSRNPIVYKILYIIYRLSAPILTPIQRLLQQFLPSMGGLDISPVIALLLIYFIRDLMRELWVNFI